MRFMKGDQWDTLPSILGRANGATINGLNAMRCLNRFQTDYRLFLLNRCLLLLQ